MCFGTLWRVLFSAWFVLYMLWMLHVVKLCPLYTQSRTAGTHNRWDICSVLNIHQMQNGGVHNFLVIIWCVYRTSQTRTLYGAKAIAGTGWPHSPWWFALVGEERRHIPLWQVLVNPVLLAQSKRSVPAREETVTLLFLVCPADSTYTQMVRAHTWTREMCCCVCLWICM